MRVNPSQSERPEFRDTRNFTIIRLSKYISPRFLLAFFAKCLRKVCNEGSVWCEVLGFFLFALKDEYDLLLLCCVEFFGNTSSNARVSAAGRREDQRNSQSVAQRAKLITVAQSSLHFQFAHTRNGNRTRQAKRVKMAKSRSLEFDARRDE